MMRVSNYFDPVRDWPGASVAEPADAPGLGPGVRKDVGVRISPLAPTLTCTFDEVGAQLNRRPRVLSPLGLSALPVALPVLRGQRRKVVVCVGVHSTPQFATLRASFRRTLRRSRGAAARH